MKKIKEAKIIPIKVKRFRSAERLVDNFVRSMYRRTVKRGDRRIDENGFQAGVTDQYGRNYELTDKEFINGVRASGFWGFVDRKQKVISFWAKRGTPINKFVEFFGHELGHLSGRDYKSILREEGKAEEFSSVAITAYKLAQKYNKTVR